MADHTERRLSMRELALLVTIFVTVGTQLTSLAWFASKVETTQDFTQETLKDVRDELKTVVVSVSQAITADAVRKAQIDNLLERVSRLEARR